MGNAVSATSVQLTWNSVSGATSYWIEKKEDGQSSYSSVFDNPTTTTYTVTGLKAATKYFFRVAAHNDNNGLGDYSADISVTTGRISVPAPTGVSASAVNGSSSTIKVSWNAVTVDGASSINYEVYYKPYNAGDTTTASLTKSGTYPSSETETGVSSLDPSTDYIFYVKATTRSILSSDGIDSDYSTTYARAKTNVAAPTNVDNRVVNNTTLKVTWDMVPSATSYKVYIRNYTMLDGLGIESAALETTVTTNEATITGLTYGKGYWFYVRASNADGDGTAGDTGRIIW
jgi:fibronectin type 3 domain-containing protein